MTRHGGLTDRRASAHEDGRSGSRCRHCRHFQRDPSGSAWKVGGASGPARCGEETSYGNAGLIQREGVFPYGFPHNFGALFRYALNNTIDASYHFRALPSLVPFLARYWWHSGFTQHQKIAHLYAPLIEHSIAEHQDLIDASGAGDLIRKDGWMKVFRTERSGTRPIRTQSGFPPASESITRSFRPAS